MLPDAANVYHCRMNADPDEADDRPLDSAIDRQSEAIERIGEILKPDRVNPEDLRSAVNETGKTSEEIEKAFEARRKTMLEEHMNLSPDEPK